MTRQNQDLVKLFGTGLVLATLLAALTALSGCDTEAVSPTAPTVVTVAPTPDPCECDHGTMEVRRNGQLVTKLAPHERGVSQVTGWINTSGEPMTLAACQWAGRYAWRAAGGGCAYRGDTSQAITEFVCTVPTTTADPALLTATANVHGRACSAEFRLAVEWD